MQFHEITHENFLQAIQLRPKRTQYRFICREAVLYAIGRAYTAIQPTDAMPFVISYKERYVGAIRLRYYGHGVGFSTFFIDRKHQGRGLGRLALEYLVEYVREHFPSAEEIETCVIPDNTMARQLYEKLGYEYTGVVNADTTMDMEMKI